MVAKISFSHIHEDRSLCPVSSLLNPHVDGINSYPIDIFDITSFKEIQDKNTSGLISLDKELLNDLFRCQIWVYSPPGQPNRTCSSRTSCPVDITDIEKAQKKTKAWNYKHSLCRVREAIRVGLPARVFITGGSVTSGHGTYGCCCNLQLDSKCPGLVRSDTQCSHPTKKDYTLACRWQGLFEHWLRTSISPQSVEFHDLAVAGLTSPGRADSLGEVNIHTKYFATLFYYI